MKQLQLLRFDLPSADLDLATLATHLKWPFNVGGCTYSVGGSLVYRMLFLGMSKWPRIGGWLLLRVGAHSRFYSLLHCQLYCYIHTVSILILTLYADVEYNISTYNSITRAHTVIYS